MDGTWAIALDCISQSQKCYAVPGDELADDPVCSQSPNSSAMCSCMCTDRGLQVLRRGIRSLYWTSRRLCPRGSLGASRAVWIFLRYTRLERQHVNAAGWLRNCCDRLTGSNPDFHRSAGYGWLLYRAGLGDDDEYLHRERSWCFGDYVTLKYCTGANNSHERFKCTDGDLGVVGHVRILGSIALYNRIGIRFCLSTNDFFSQPCSVYIWVLFLDYRGP